MLAILSLYMLAHGQRGSFSQSPTTAQINLSSVKLRISLKEFDVQVTLHHDKFL